MSEPPIVTRFRYVCPSSSISSPAGKVHDRPDCARRAGWGPLAAGESEWQGASALVALNSGTL